MSRNIVLKVIENANRWYHVFLDLLTFVPTRNPNPWVLRVGLGCFEWVQMSSNPKINGTSDLHFQLPLKRYITVHDIF